MLRFVRMMEDGLRGRGRTVETIAPAVFFGRGRVTSHGSGKWLGYLDKYIVFPWMLRRRVRRLERDAVVQICDHSNAVYAPAAGSAGHPVLVVCHDMGAVRGALGEATDCPATPMGRRLQRWIARSLGRADLIACDSTATRKDVERLVRRPDGSPPETRLVLLGLNAPFRRLDPAEADARLAAVDGVGEGRPFVLNVGSSLRRKNRDGVLRIFARVAKQWPEGRLVFAGEALPSELVNLSEELGIAERVVQVAGPSNATLEALYNRALALLFPSRFEGFGWPVIEAQACGCPVLCSNAGSLGEVAGSGAFVRPVEDEEAFAREWLRLASDEGARAAWIEVGTQNPRASGRTKWSGLTRGSMMNCWPDASPDAMLNRPPSNTHENASHGFERAAAVDVAAVGAGAVFWIRDSSDLPHRAVVGIPKTLGHGGAFEHRQFDGVQEPRAGASRRTCRGRQSRVDHRIPPGAVTAFRARTGTTAATARRRARGHHAPTSHRLHEHRDHRCVHDVCRVPVADSFS